MFQSTKIRTILVIILFLSLIVLTRGLFIDVTRDSGKYASIAKEIYIHGNWINLTIHGEPYLQKPPLMFWLSALSYYLFGISNCSFKLPILLFSLAGLYFTYRLGKNLYNKYIGILSAIMLLFSEFFLLYNMDIHTDSMLLPLVTFSLWQLSEYIQQNKTKYLIGASVGIGLAMLTKGPVGAVIPAFATGTHLLMKKNYKQFFDPRWLIVFCIVFIIITPTLLSLYRQFGINGIKFYFWTNNIGRVTGQYMGTNTDYLYFFHTLLYMLLPWSLFFYYAAFNEFRRLFNKKFRASEYFTLGGIWIFFIILSISRSKLPNYIYAITPLMTITTAKWMYFAIKKRQSKMFCFLKISQTITEIIIWSLILVISVYLFPADKVFTWIITGVFFFFYILFKLKIKMKESPLLNSILVMLALAFFLNFHVFPEIYSQQAVPRAARLFNQISQSDDKLYNYQYSQYELFFYGRGEVGQINNQAELEQTMKCGNAWIFTNEEGLSEIKNDPSRFPSDSIISFRHVLLNKGFRYINPKTREESKENMYLLQCK